MIPLYKLEKLPRTQQLRKIAKIFTMAENRLCAAHLCAAQRCAARLREDIEKEGDKKEGIFSAGLFSTAEQAFFIDAAGLLSKDTLFSLEARKALNEAADVFQAAINTPVSIAQYRRAVNSVKHLLLTATGRDQADWDFTGSDGRLDSAKRRIFEGMWVYMEDIRSPFNVGAMFRTAESFGVEKIILSPLCADPRHKRAQRTAMGCVDIIPWERQEIFASPESPRLPFPVFALETGGVPITEFPFPRQGLLIAGSEELGVSPRALAAADASLGRVSIPCCGAKASLNVSVAFGIAVHFWEQNLSAQDNWKKN